MSRNGCGQPADMLFKSVKNEHLIYEINSTVIMIGTLMENQGIEATLKTLQKEKNDAI